MVHGSHESTGILIHARRLARLFAGMSRRAGFKNRSGCELTDRGSWTVVDFVREKPIDVDSAAELLKVNALTVRRWFKRGLDCCKLGGKVFTSLEAINRFQTDMRSNPMVQAVVVDQETMAALRSLRKQGFSVRTESASDGNKAKATVGR
jgi:hypothetical protein